MQNALMIDPRYSAFFGPQDAGSGSATMGNGNGAGWMQGLANLPGSEAYYTAAQGNGDSEQAARIDPNALYAYLQAQGYNLNEMGVEGDQVERWISNSTGQDVGDRERIATDDQNFWTGALLAGATVGGATAGWANAGNGLGSTGTIGAGTGSQAGLAATGTEAGIGTLGAVPGGSLPAVGAGSTGGLTATGTTAGIGSLGQVGGGSLATVGGGGGAASGLGSFLTGGGSASDYMRAGSTLAGLYTTNRATDAANQGEANNLALQTRMYEDSKANNQPLLDLRNAQIPRINALMADPSSVTSEPGYQFGLKQGQDQINNSMAARGGYYSGQQMKASQKYGQDYAGTKLDQSLNRLMNVAGLGQQGATAQQNANTNYGQQGGQSMVNSGNNRSSGYIGYGNTLNNGVNNYMQDSYFDQMLNRKGP